MQLGVLETLDVPIQPGVRYFLCSISCAAALRGCACEGVRTYGTCTMLGCVSGLLQDVKYQNRNLVKFGAGLGSVHTNWPTTSNAHHRCTRLAAASELQRVHCEYRARHVCMRALRTVSLVTTVFSNMAYACLLYTSPSPRDRQKSRMPSSA